MRFILSLELALVRGCLATAATDIPTDAEIKTILQSFIERDHWGVGMVVGIVDERGTRTISCGKLDNGNSPEVSVDCAKTRLCRVGTVVGPAKIMSAKIIDFLAVLDAKCGHSVLHSTKRIQ